MTLDDIQRVKRFYNNFAVTLGIGIGFILGIYFFTFSELVDKAPPIVWKIQALTTVLMVIVLIYIKRVSFFATRLWLGRRPSYQPIFATCRSAADLEKSEEQLLGELQR